MGDRIIDDDNSLLKIVVSTSQKRRNESISDHPDDVVTSGNGKRHLCLNNVVEHAEETSLEWSPQSQC